MNDFLLKSTHTLELPAVLEMLAERAVSTEQGGCAGLSSQNVQGDRRMQLKSRSLPDVGHKGNPSFYGIKKISALSRPRRAPADNCQ